MLNIIVYLVEPWDVFHRRPMLEALARNGEGTIRLLCVNPVVTPSYRRKYWTQSLIEWQSAKKSIQQVETNLFVYTPRSLIHSILKRSARVKELYKKRIGSELNQTLEQLQMKDGVIVAWVFRPAQIDLLGLAHERQVIYECYDEYQVDIATGKFLYEVQKNEYKLLSETSIVFAVSRTLYEKRSRWHPNAHFVTNGADVEHFGKAQDENVPIAPELLEIKRPIIGYPGNLDHFVNIELLEYIADTHPDWSVVLLGKIGSGVSISSLKSRENVHYLGYKPYELLPTFSKAFDVVILPFIINEYLRCSNPLILWEQLAAGNLLVSTNFNEDVNDHDDIIWVSDNKEDFVVSIEEALSGNHEDRIKKGLQLVQLNSWDVITRKHLKIITETCMEYEEN